MSRSARRRGALAVAAFAVGLLGFAAAGAPAAAAVPAPRDALKQALHQVQPLASQASASAAAAELTRATARDLWINDREADAPPYGRNIFAASRQAVGKLAGVSAPVTNTAIGLIITADRSLASNAIAEAHGGPATVLEAAMAALSTGNRQAHAGKLSAAIDLYAEAWQSAFGALAHLVAGEVTRVPSATLAAAAEQALAGTRFGMSGPMIQQSLPPLTSGGKPEVFYAGSEACPFCGVQRWGMIAALSQFGTFSNLHLMQSVPMTPPQVRTFTFFGSSYQSPYVSLVPVEVWSNVPANPGLVRLQSLTHAESVLLNRFDPAVETPFIDVANRFIIDSSTVDPQLIAHKSWTQLAAGLADPSNVSTQAIAGEAEVMTAELCEATGGNPASVCSSTVVQQYEAALPTLTGKGGSCPAPPGPGGPPPARDAGANRTARSGPVAVAASRCQG
ncbi:MAG: DUF929 family protein [Solirubrobacterales bacterium]|nr:DUF929 family protein [Solirubrobacterales bacterium]